MFSWFFRKSTPVELHTTYIDNKTWVAELNSGDQLQTVKELFAITFDADNFTVIDEGSSVNAILSGDEKYQCTLTFGYNGDNHRIAVISYNDDEDESIVKPSINAFGVELENYSLLFDMPIKEQKPLENFMIPMKDVVHEKDIIRDEEVDAISMMLRENVDVKKMLLRIAKFVKEKYLLEGKTEAGKMCFCEKGNEKFRITIQIGRNSEKQRVMAISASEKRVYWKELSDNVVEILMKGKCFASYAVTASLRRNLKKCTTKVEKKEEQVEEKKEIQIDMEKVQNEKKEENGEKKEEKKDEVQIDMEKK